MSISSSKVTFFEHFVACLESAKSYFMAPFKGEILC